MSSRPWPARIRDILESVANIGEYTVAMSFADFVADKNTIRVVAYEFIVIGEAARHIPRDVELRYPDVPWAKMRGLRNVAIHEYFRIDVSILWETLTHDLPPLAPLLRDILERER